MAVLVRPAQQSDADAMAVILNEIIAIGGTTAHRRRFDADAIVTHFVAPDRAISCFVALEADRAVGFQALEWADPDWPGEDPLPGDWAVISTYVAPGAHGCGVGRLLFAETSEAAASAGVRYIDATIRHENTGGQAFYAKLGFVDYRKAATSVCKRFAPVPASLDGRSA